MTSGVIISLAFHNLFHTITTSRLGGKQSKFDLIPTSPVTSQGLSLESQEAIEDPRAIIKTIYRCTSLSRALPSSLDQIQNGDPRVVPRRDALSGPSGFTSLYPKQ